MKKYIVIKTNFPAIHNWPGCNVPEVEYLKHPHRHLFYAVIRFKIDHNNRDIEFINMKSKIDEYINLKYKEKNIGAMSCESIAEDILIQFNADFVSIFEDNENGAEIYGNLY